MKNAPIRIIMAVCLALPLTLALGCQSGPGVKGSPADLAAIDKLWQQFTLADNTGDLDLMMSLWTEDGVRMAPDAPAVVGKTRIREAEKPMFEAMKNKLTLYPEQTLVSGDLAFSRGVAVLSMTPKAGGKTTTIKAKYGTVLVRQKDGSWKVAVDNFNLDEPPREE
jgi:uncharacterized protein (TIGR02246 family)